MILIKNRPGCPKPPDVMLAIVKIKINQRLDAVVLLDNGSNTTVITHAFADRLNLQGKFMWQELELCGRPPEWVRVKYYTIDMTVFDEDKRMRVFKVRLIGVDKITTNPGSYDVSIAYDI